MDPFFFEEKTRDAAGRRAVLDSMLPKLEAMEEGGNMSLDEAEERIATLGRMAWTVDVVAVRAKGPREKAEIESIRGRIAVTRRELQRSLRGSGNR